MEFDRELPSVDDLDQFGEHVIELLRGGATEFASGFAQRNVARSFESAHTLDTGVVNSCPNAMRVVRKECVDELDSVDLIDVGDICWPGSVKHCPSNEEK